MVNGQNETEFTKEYIVDILIKEYDRVAAGFHRAIDNYYKIIPLLISLLGLATGLLTRTDMEFIFTFFPYFLLIVLFLESQIRATITCASKYLALIENRVNKITGTPLLLYESKLTLGITLYYSMNRYSIIKYFSYFPFIIIGAFVYVLSIYKVYVFFKAQMFFVFFDYIFPSNILFIGYILLLGICTILSLISWFSLFAFSLKSYDKLIEKILMEESFK